jgi:protocatechuate 3,4-dioxygenase beta subunit
MTADRTRRSLLQIAATFSALGAFSPLNATLAQSLRRTPEQILGPFYPRGKATDDSGDLTHLAGRTERASGQILNVMGRVLNMNGDPLSGAKLEIWQANSFGRYTHPADHNPAPLDPNFNGFEALKTDAEGRYRFKTIMPGAYPVSPHVMRTPHIHFRLVGRRDELVTQMYFEGEPLNAKDPILQSVAYASRELLIARLLPPTPDLEPDSRLVMFDLVTLVG